MTAPREVLPGRCYLITRRCTRREFLLRPDEVTNKAFLYCLGEAAQRYGIDVVSVLALSNHWHGIVYDRDGRFPEFLAHFHKLVAKVLNARWGRWDDIGKLHHRPSQRLVTG